MNEELIPKPKTSFVQIKCPSCGNMQTVFSSPTRRVKCLVCENNLLSPKGSKGEFTARILNTVDKDFTGKEFKLTRGNRRKMQASPKKIQKKFSTKEQKKEE